MPIEDTSKDDNVTASWVSPHLRYHLAVQKARALCRSADDPVGQPSLFRLRLAHPDIALQALLYQTLDVLLWLTGEEVVRLRFQATLDGACGLIVLGNGCVCAVDLEVGSPAVLALELHGRRGLLLYDDAATPAARLQPRNGPKHDLLPWSEQCQPGAEGLDVFPSQTLVEGIWRAALASLASGDVWQPTGVPA